MWDPISGTLTCGAPGKGARGRGLPPQALRGSIRASWPSNAGEASPGLQDPAPGTLGQGAQGKGALCMGLPPRAVRGPSRASWSRKAKWPTRACGTPFRVL